MPADDLALLAHRLDRRSYLHDPFRICSRRGGSGDPDGHRYHAPGAQTFAHLALAGPSATKQNTKQVRRAISPLSAVLGTALVAAFCLVSGVAEAAPPVLVHGSGERFPAASVAGSGVPGTGGGSAGSPPWMRYPGRWGGARAGWFPPEQSSPRGPALQGTRWDDPEAFARSARPCTRRRCVAVGACDGAETALAGGFVAALLVLAGVVVVRQRGRRR
jgi:hypothetical protein